MKSFLFLSVSLPSWARFSGIKCHTRCHGEQGKRDEEKNAGRVSRVMLVEMAI